MEFQPVVWTHIVTEFLYTFYIYTLKFITQKEPKIWLLGVTIAMETITKLKKQILPTVKPYYTVLPTMNMGE